MQLVYKSTIKLLIILTSKCIYPKKKRTNITVNQKGVSYLINSLFSFWDKYHNKFFDSKRELLRKTKVYILI
jgi:hypothetical protein